MYKDMSSLAHSLSPYIHILPFCSFLIKLSPLFASFSFLFPLFFSFSFFLYFLFSFHSFYFYSSPKRDAPKSGKKHLVCRLQSRGSSLAKKWSRVKKYYSTWLIKSNVTRRQIGIDSKVSEMVWCTA